MKRIIAYFLTIAVAFCMFGCGAESQEETNDVTEETNMPVETEFPVDQYDLDAYMTPYWKGNTVYQESVMVLENDDGTISDIPLLYAAKQIVCVRTSDLATQFTEGTDYVLADGKLRILPDSAIPAVAYSEYYPREESERTMVRNENFGSGYIFYAEGAAMHKMQIAVTYIHEGVFAGEIPAYKGDRLPKTQAKLQNGEALKITIFGDSISTGLNSSGYAHVAPMADPWFTMFTKKLQAQYPDAQITCANPSVSGKTSQWGAKEAETLLENDTDLCVIAFGANDGTGRNPEPIFKNNIQNIMNTALAKNPDCEFVLISTMLPNQEAGRYYGIQKDYLPELLSLETTGVVVADVTTFHEGLLQIKRYCDISGNNVNHPNDFLARAYAQIMWQTVVGY